MDDVHGEGMPGEKPAEFFPSVQEAAEERNQRKAHPHGEDRIPQRKNGRLPAAAAYPRAARANQRRREQGDRREYGQNKTHLPKRPGDRPEPAPSIGKNPDQKEAQVLRQIGKRRELEQRRAIRNNDPEQIADSRQRQREEGNFRERKPGKRSRGRALRFFFIVMRQARYPRSSTNSITTNHITPRLKRPDAALPAGECNL